MTIDLSQLSDEELRSRHVLSGAAYTSEYGELERRRAAVAAVRIEGALYGNDELAALDFQAAQAQRIAHPFQLGILRRSADGTGEIASPDEVEPGHPCWFSASRFAKAAGAALIARYPETLGYDVLKVKGGHWRSVHTEWKPAADGSAS